MTSGPATPAVAFITLGCPKNEVDTDKMRSAIVSSAFTLADDMESADVVVINTCSFIQVATEESIETVLDIASRWLPQREDRRIVVAGCMPSRYGDGLTAEMPEVAAFLPVAEEAALLDTLERITGVSARMDGTSARRTQTGPSAYLQISDGCHRKCAYCTIPAIRGPYRSRELADILAEAGELVALGARELVLIGQDITAWGRDLEGPETLANVVRAVAAVPGVEWLRLMYAQPDGVTDELLSAMAENPNVCRYLDMPLQHASRDVLRAMRRSGDAETFLALIDRARFVMPDITLRTTVIAGFPGETTRDVNELLRFIEAARFDYVGVFAYSAEDGTPAAEMPDQVPSRTRRARAQRVRDVADAVGFEKVSQHVGEVLEVLVEGFDPDEEAVVGRWRGQAPEIDGIVLLDKGEPGEIASARIVDSLGYDLEGEVVS
jgi:ribosomal protein S12 methylthiotransferase